MEMADEASNYEAYLKQKILELQEKLEQKEHGARNLASPAKGSSLAACLLAEAWLVFLLCLLAGGLFAAVCWGSDVCVHGEFALFVRKHFRRGAEQLVDQLYDAGKEELI